MELSARVTRTDSEAGGIPCHYGGVDRLRNGGSPLTVGNLGVRSGVQSGRNDPCTSETGRSRGRASGSVRIVDHERRTMIDRQTVRMQHARSRLRTGAAAMLGLLLVAGTLYAAVPVQDRTGRETSGAGPNGTVGLAGGDVPSLMELESRVQRVERGWARLAAYYDTEVAPIEDVLLRYSDDRELVSRVATAVVREAHAADLEPRLLLGVLLVENPWLDPSARSFVGAVGLMQVMPVHQGGWSCGWDLEQIDTNVCLGARVFAHYLQRTGGNVEKALLRYNGCVTGSNTPNCHEYPSRVLERAGGSSQLAWSGGGSVSAGSP